MFCIQASLTQLKRDETGIATTEYALVAALIAFVLIGAIGSYGSGLAAAFGGISSAFNNAQAASAPGATFCRQQPLPFLPAPDNSCQLGTAGTGRTAAGTGSGLAFAE